MARRKRSKTEKAKKSSKRRPGAVAAAKSDKEAARHLDAVVDGFERAVDGLQSNVEQLRDALPELVALGVRRDRMQRIKVLADDGILHSLHRLATAIDDCSVTGGLPASLVPLQRSARMALDHFCRTFEVQAVWQPGESRTVTHEQIKDFDWSADPSGEISFPAEVEILRSGWKAGDEVFVLPAVGRRSRGASA